MSMVGTHRKDRSLQVQNSDDSYERDAGESPKRLHEPTKTWGVPAQYAYSCSLVGILVVILTLTI
eukprot:1101970-Amorphochlora_amoeboformis.AAC.1